MDTTTQVLTTLGDFDLDGYEPGFPDSMSRAAQVIDQAEGDDAECAACDRIGLAVHPYRSASGYRVFVVCPRCGHAEEF